MKKVLSIIFVSFGLSTLHAQFVPEKGFKQLNAGVGLSSWGFPVYVGMDFGLDKNITAGGELSFRSYSDKWYGYRYRHRVIGVSVNGNYHFNSLLGLPEKLDVYAGLNVGYYFWGSDSGYPGDHISGLGLGGQLGGRYYFNDKLGINLEFGSGNAFSGGKFGISLKF